MERAPNAVSLMNMGYARKLSPGAVLVLLTAALLNSAHAGGYQGPSWQQTSSPPPNAVGIEPKLTKAFVVHVPIPTQYTVASGGNHQSRPNGPTPAPPVPFRSAAPQQVSPKSQQPAELDQQHELKKLVILLRIPQEQPLQSLDKTPQPPTPPDKTSYNLQVDKQLPIILIALDKPLPPHAKVQSVTTWKEPIQPSDSPKEDRSSSSKEWQPINPPQRSQPSPQQQQRQQQQQQQQQQQPQQPQQKSWSSWNKDSGQRNSWNRDQGPWKSVSGAANVQEHQDGKEAKILLLLVNDNGQGKGWQQPPRQNVQNEQTNYWRPSNPPQPSRQQNYQQQHNHQQHSHQEHNQHHQHHHRQQDVEEKSWRSVAPSLAWSAASPQQRNWQYQDPLPYHQPRSPSASQAHYYVQRKDGFTDRFTVHY